MEAELLGMALHLARVELRAALSLVSEATEVLLDTRANPDGALSLHKAVLRLATATDAFAKASKRYLEAQKSS